MRCLKWLGLAAVVLAVWLIAINWQSIVGTFREEWPALISVIVCLLLFYLFLRLFGRRLLILIFRIVNKVISWHKLPPSIGILNTEWSVLSV